MHFLDILGIFPLLRSRIYKKKIKLEQFNPIFRISKINNKIKVFELDFFNGSQSQMKYKSVLFSRNLLYTTINNFVNKIFSYLQKQRIYSSANFYWIIPYIDII